MPANSPHPLSLLTALRLNQAVQLALVGAGGKTHAMFQLAYELASQFNYVLVTTSTHLGRDQVNQADHHFVLNPQENFPFHTVLDKGIICISGAWDDSSERWQGLTLNQLAQLSQFAHQESIPLLIEADGSRQLPIKAPAEHEPLIPTFVDTVIVIAGLNGLHQPLGHEWVHRPQIYADLSGLKLGDPLTTPSLATVLCHPQGGLKNIPPHSRKICLLTHADDIQSQAESRHLSQLLRRCYATIVVVSALHHASSNLTECGFYQVIAIHEATAGIVLAAGASQRFGKPKQLLQWKGETLVHHAARVALEASLDPVIVVCGSESELVQNAVADLPVKIVFNPDWQAGQSTSIQAGLKALPAHVGAAVFLLADQPHVSPSVLRLLVDDHSHNLASIIGPLVDGQRANPVLFDRRTFGALLELQGDIGGRALFSRYPPRWLPWHDKRLRIDIDTPDAYQQLINDQYD
ncbi:MAG: selenium cofactor biosynthesis protein YqeC [Anaerolineales bacterium]